MSAGSSIFFLSYPTNPPLKSYFPERPIQKKQMELNFKTLGQGDPVIILHGLFGTLDNWQTIAKSLAELFTVVLVDQRNHGRSPHAPEFNYPILAEDLRDFMHQQWIHKAHILGHSMGGKTAMQFALDFPDMVNRLIVVDIAPHAYQGGHQEIFEALFSVKLDQLSDRKEADEQLASKIDEMGVRQFLLKNLTRQKNGGYQWKMNLPVLFERYPDILAAIVSNRTFDGPALFLRGEKSRYIQEEHLPEIESLFPHFKLETIKGAGHWVHADQPDALLAQLTDFLSVN